MRLKRHGKFIQVIEADGFRIGQAYMMKSGWYKGYMLRLDWIAKQKHLYIFGTGARERQMSGAITHHGKQIQINTYPSELWLQVPVIVGMSIEQRLSKSNNVTIIKLASTGNKAAIKEFIRRFKKVPKLMKKDVI